MSRFVVPQEELTPEKLRELDGKVAWVRDDYLSMRGLASDDPDLLAYLDHVAAIKEKARSAGARFSA